RSLQGPLRSRARRSASVESRAGCALRRFASVPPCASASGRRSVGRGAGPATSEAIMTTEVATFGGGCFWCLEAAFLELDGVLEVQTGYAGGHVENPDDRTVCTGTTGHAEVVQVTYDPGRITYDDLLNVFFTIHDPTTPD